MPERRLEPVRAGGWKDSMSFMSFHVEIYLTFWENDMYGFRAKMAPETSMEAAHLRARTIAGDQQRVPHASYLQLTLLQPKSTDSSLPTP